MTDYNIEAIQGFIDTVFPEIPPENINLKAGTHAPYGPLEPSPTVLDKMRRSETPVPCYYALSTAHGLHAVVIDAQLPGYTYKIETEDETEYGYVFNEPISDPDSVFALLKILNWASKGRLSAGSLAKLPCGAGYVSHEIEGATWTPEGLLTVLEIYQKWEGGQDDQEFVEIFGAAAINGTRFYNYNGIYDPVFEWMHPKMTDGVVHDTGWAQVTCPWGDDHLAVYSPIGYGKQRVRKFQCTDEGCAQKTIRDFLSHLHNDGCQLYPEEEHEPGIRTQHVYNMGDDCAYLVTHPHIVATPSKILQKTVEMDKVSNGRRSYGVSPVTTWLRSPYCVTLSGKVYDPTSTDKIVSVGDARYLNTFSMPVYQERPIEMDRVRPFLDFIQYLLPEEQEQEYFLNFLAAKVQFRDYRGPAVVMIAPTEGAGRNTLMKFIGKLFGDQNVTRAKLKDLKSDKDNSYMASQFVYIDETLAERTLEERKQFYEAIKQAVDPLAQYITLKKGRSQTDKVVTTASFLFFSNHTGAIYADKGTRRFFVCRNPEKVEGPNYFRKVHRFLAEDDWPEHLWNYLQGRPVDFAEMSGKPPRTEAHDKMQAATDNRIDDVIDVAFDIMRSWGEMASPSYLYKVVSRHIPECLPQDMPEKQFTRAVMAKTLSMNKLKGFQPIVSNKTMPQRVRAINPEIAGDLAMANKCKSLYRDFLYAVPEKKFAQYIKEGLSTKVG